MTRRLIASYLLLTVLILGVLVIPLGISFADRQVDELTSDVERDAFALASFVEEELEEPADHGDGESTEPAAGEGVDLQAVADSYEERTGGRLVIVDIDGLAVADSSPPSPGERYFRTRPEIESALSGEVATGTRSSETLGEPLVYVAVPVASGGTVHGALRISYPRHEVDERIRENWLRLGAISVVSLLAAAGIGWALARSVTSPLRRLQVAATALGAGDLTTRAPAGQGPREVRRLAGEFNDMAGRLEELVTAQEAFVADASHQLRTPLTALRLRLENLEASVPEADQADVEAAAREVARLSRLVDGLLTLARADRTSAQVVTEPLDLGQALTERLEAWAPLAEEQGVDLRLDLADGVPLVARATSDRVAQIVDNYLSNAVDASPPGGTVRLRAVPATRPDPDGRDCVEIHVVDEGPGLTDEERERAFDRFWRASQATGGLGGTGLGLAIVEKLARADGGEARLEAAETGGLDAIVRYPVD